MTEQAEAEQEAACEPVGCGQPTGSPVSSLELAACSDQPHLAR
ncbi:MAG: hypothetical protein NTV57_02420 [Cyanobacteria bacterium]|nr:hypothetical protein [Cyanobacteriota bacterium]